MKFTGTTVLRIENGKIVEEIGEEGALTALQQLGLVRMAIGRHVAPPNRSPIPSLKLTPAVVRVSLCWGNNQALIKDLTCAAVERASAPIFIATFEHGHHAAMATPGGDLRHLIRNPLEV